MANEPKSAARKAAEDAAREILYPNGEALESYGEDDVSEVAAIIMRHQEAACSQPVAPGHEYKHWPWCNGDRRVPAGEPGHSCCCFNAKAEKSLQTILAQCEAAPPAVSTPLFCTATTHTADCQKTGECDVAGAVSTPRCPKCSGRQLEAFPHAGRPYGAVYCITCGGIGENLEFAALAQFFQPVSQPPPWVSVKERLPEFTREIKSDGLRYSDELLVFDADGTCAIIQATLNQFDGEPAKWVSDHMGSELHRVTHWMPLPAQPSPEGERE